MKEAAQLANGVLRGEPSALEELYLTLSTGPWRCMLLRRFGVDYEDAAHDLFLVVVKAVQRGDLREPDKLFSFAAVIAQRQFWAVIRARISQNSYDVVALRDRAPNPEERLINEQRGAFGRLMLCGLPKRQAELLTRFYLDEQPHSDICREMDLTHTQFRLLKSRAKRRLGDHGRNRLARRAGA